VSDSDRPGGPGDDARPAFAREFPRDPELDALVAAFEQGNFARVRRGAKAIAASSAEEGVKRAAKLLAARTTADPLAAVLLALTAVLLLALSAFWITHNGSNAPP
jgi:hypothetical protein